MQGTGSQSAVPGRFIDFNYGVAQPLLSRRFYAKEVKGGKQVRESRALLRRRSCNGSKC